MKKVTVQFIAPVNVTIMVSSVTEDEILDSAWADLKDPYSENTWKPTRADLNEIVRSAQFVNSDWEKFIECDEDFIIAYC